MFATWKFILDFVGVSECVKRNIFEITFFN